MSDRMRTIPFAGLMDWILTEYHTKGSIFGVEKLYRAGENTLPLFRETIETPFGPAAGPHTQLAQNLVAGYAAGGRFFELKTVQTLDGEDLPVSKPCILAADEGYNCEWSTELRVQEAFEEYVKGWFALKLLARECALGGENGFVFNMSVGYDLAGIRSKKIDTFIEGLKDASAFDIWGECKAWALRNLERFSQVDAAYVEEISPRICSSITLSTLHGCPSAEIERIAAYLIEEKKLHTFVKCNPTLLGYEFVRDTVDTLGFDQLSFGDFHFRDDLQFADAVPMFQRLSALADANGMTFGVKLSNTLPVDIVAGELPGKEMYLSGRALFPLTVALAKKLTQAFDGRLRISYSGGADAHNITALFEAGIWPITLATTLLKPGGYARLHQMAKALAACPYRPFTVVSAAQLGALAQHAMTDPHYRKAQKPAPPRKNRRQVPLTDCFFAPCREGCPIEQDIPAYLRLADEGRYREALSVILERNPLPFITGTICPHRCEERCTRTFYERAVEVRAVKLTCARQGAGALLDTLHPAALTGKKAAVVGGGAAGLSAAFFLARAGVEVTLFEKTNRLGGLVRTVIPAFRIPDASIDCDIALVRAMGVRFEMGQEIRSPEALRAQGFDAVVLAVGAKKRGTLALEYGEAKNALDFLAQAKASPETLSPGRQVAVIGGGNTAVDAARAAVRLPGVQKVALVYRRTRRYMPADEEELAAALADGVSLCELLAPVGVKNGVLTCEKMVLGVPDHSGRRAPAATGEQIELAADTVLAAVGEQVDSDFYAACGLLTDARGRAAVNPDTLESSIRGVYVAGDGNHGPATVVEAIADAAKVAAAIAGADFERFAVCNAGAVPAQAQAKKGLLDEEETPCSETARCLECASVCALCADVCPNRANVELLVEGKTQIVHLDGLCNECGNCATFCPYDSAPYRDKFTLFWSKRDFEESENEGFLPLKGGKLLVRLDHAAGEYALEQNELPADLSALMRTVCGAYSYLLAQAKEETAR